MTASKLAASFMVLGRCMPSEVQNAVKLRVKRLEFDKNLHMYFPSYETLYAHDPQKACKPGDVILVQQLPQKVTKQISHAVKKVVFPLGDVLDPVTGKPVVGEHYREDLEERKRLYGRKPGEKVLYGSAYYVGLRRSRRKQSFSTVPTFWKVEMDLWLNRRQSHTGRS
nr:EOG090X0GMQ [Triops cancriformis]